MASSVAVKNMHRYNLVTILFLIFCFLFNISSAQLTKALFVFGDSLVDVGNNNYLPQSFLKVNYPQHGIDFPNHQYTGRFSNGKNAADFLAEKLGLASSPPYLQLKHLNSGNFSAGVSFASGGAGILNGTNSQFFVWRNQTLSMNTQIDSYVVVHEKLVQQLGAQGAQAMLSQSLFAVVIGSNDIFAYIDSSNSGSNNIFAHSDSSNNIESYDIFASSNSSQMKKDTPQQYVNSMVLDFKGQLKRLYDLGARKFAIFGVAAVGCCPRKRDKTKPNGYPCNEKANSMASNYNKGLVSFLKDYQTQLKDFQYTYFDTYALFSDFIQQPATYGFKEEKEACCGIGRLHADWPCLPFPPCCTNRSDHVFWDYYHPTEAASRITIETAFNGPPKYAFPVNIKQLVST